MSTQAETQSNGTEPNLVHPAGSAELARIETPFPTDGPDEVFVSNSVLSHHLDFLHHLIQFSGLRLVISGPDGSGKTSLLNQLFRRATDTWRISRILASEVMSPADLIDLIMQGFGLPNRGGDMAVKLGQIDAFLDSLRAAGLVGVIAIDDAHRLPRETQDRLTALSSDWQSYRTRLLWTQVPGVESRLPGATESSSARDTVHVIELSPFNEAETREYVRTRLRRAGYEGDALLASSASKSIYKTSGGWPGAINQIASGLLAPKAGSGLVGSSRWPKRWTRLAGAAALVACLGVGLTFAALQIGGDADASSTDVDNTQVDNAPPDNMGAHDTGTGIAPQNPDNSAPANATAMSAAANNIGGSQKDGTAVSRETRQEINQNLDQAANKGIGIVTAADSVAQSAEAAVTGVSGTMRSISTRTPLTPPPQGQAAATTVAMLDTNSGDLTQEDSKSGAHGEEPETRAEALGRYVDDGNNITRVNDDAESTNATPADSMHSKRTRAQDAKAPATASTDSESAPATQVAKQSTTLATSGEKSVQPIQKGVANIASVRLAKANVTPNASVKATTSRETVKERVKGVTARTANVTLAALATQATTQAATPQATRAPTNVGVTRASNVRGNANNITRTAKATPSRASSSDASTAVSLSADVPPDIPPNVPPNVPPGTAQIHSAAWLAAQPASHFTIQLMGSHSPAAIGRYLRTHPALASSTSGTAWFLTTHAAQPWYVIVNGSFASYDAAKAAIASLPAKVRSNSPWPRSIGEIVTR